jgi:hypothetical protein
MSELRKVERAAAKVAAARAGLELAIRQARSEGASLRAVATAAGVSHEQVRRLSG